MAAGDRIIIGTGTNGIRAGELIPQAEAEFTENQWGWDTGQRSWVTHPDTAKGDYPVRHAADTEWPRMYITDVIPKKEESGLIHLTAIYRGAMRYPSGAQQYKGRKLPSTDVAMWNIPALSGGQPANIVAPVPKPRGSYEYLTAISPTNNGVGNPFSAIWLPSLPSFLISYTPDPDQTPSRNYRTGWILDSRSWEDVADQLWLVREEASYYFPITV